MSPNERDRLLDRYLHGSLDEDQERRVQKLLLQDPEAARRLAELSLIDCMLIKLTEEDQVVEDDGICSVLGEVIEQDEQVRAWEGAHLAQVHREEIRIVAANAFERFKEQERRRQEELARRRYLARRRQLTVGACATIALFLVSVSAWLANRPRVLENHSDSKMVHSDGPAVLPVVARISRASEAHWRKRDIAPVVGTGLTAGRMFLDKGFLEITFRDDARLIVEAPAKIELVDGRRVRLRRGTLTAHVPQEARGFEVETPSARVTDLGTEFALVVDNRGAAEVHVLDGWVATSFTVTGRDKQQQVKALYQDHAMCFDARAGIMRTIDVDGERFARSWDDVLYKPSIEGNIQFQRFVPTSLCMDALEHNEFIRLLLERTDVVLKTDTKVSVVEAGIYESFGQLSGTLPAGTMVDSYLLHWDPVDTPDSHTMASGRVTFRRPILGVIIRFDDLIATDALLGIPNVNYPVKGDGRLESFRQSQTGDKFTLSEDRQTLEVTLQARKTNGLDQIRILVAAPSSEER